MLLLADAMEAKAAPPVIINTNEPANVTAFLGQSPAFSVAVSSATLVGYQWQFNGAPLVGETNQTLTLVGAVTNESGLYSVVITNNSGSVTSRLATVTVSEPNYVPRGVTGLANLVAYRGLNGLVVNATVTGDNLNGGIYGSDIYTDDSYLPKAVVHAGWLTNGETGTVSILILPDNGSYTSTTRNGITSSSYGTWLGSFSPVGLVPTFTNQPVHRVAFLGSPVTFTSGAVCRSNFTYQWLHNGVTMPGKTSATLDIAAAAPGDSGSYAVQARMATGTNTSETAQLIVLPGDNASPAILDSGNIILNALSGVAGTIYHVTTVGNTNFGTAWGTGIYTYDSTLARVAVHAGFLAHGATGTVAVVFLPGQASYLASARNGVQTFNFGTVYRSYALVDSAPVFQPICTNLAVMIVPATTNCVVSTNTVCVTNSVVLTPAPTNCYFVIQSFTNTIITYVTNTYTSATAPTNGLVSWWRGEGNALDSAGTNHGTLHGSATFVPGHEGQTFSTGSADGGVGGTTNGSYVEVGHLPALDNATGLTISTWLQVTNIFHFTEMVLFSQANWRIRNCTNGAIVDASGRLAFEIILSENSSILNLLLPMAPEPTNVCEDYRSSTNVNSTFGPAQTTNEWVHLSVTWRSSDGLVKFYRNGALLATNYASAGLTISKSYRDCASAPSDTNIRLGSGVIGGWAYTSPYICSPEVYSQQPALLDEMRVYNRALSGPEISQLYGEVTQYTTNVVTNLVTLVCPGSATGSTSSVPYCVNVTNTFCVATSQPPAAPGNFVCSNSIVQVCTNVFPVFSNAVQCVTTVSTNCSPTGPAVVTNLSFCTMAGGKLTIVRTTNAVNLRWSSLTNAYYLLQGSDALLPISWTNVWGIGPGTGTNIVVPDATAVRPRRFYQLLSTEP